jgi:pimeloyl-ACP methyl ester carboxylesterase
MWPGLDPPPVQPGTWDSLADDLLAGLRQHELPPLIGVGHSFGAIASLLAAIRDPSRFTALAMLDPTIPPPAYMEVFRAERARGETPFRPLMQGARKRRSRFATGEEAFEYWRSKPLFADWSDEAVWRYTRAMLHPIGDGGFTLTWSSAWEAHYYESFFPDTWDRIGELDASLPLLIVGGAASDTLLPEAAALLRERLPWASHVSLPARGHLFPQSAPAETGEVLRTWLSGLAPPPRSSRTAEGSPRREDRA